MALMTDVEIIKKAKRICKYPDCYYYTPGAKYYCCNACTGDHHDYSRLKKEAE